MDALPLLIVYGGRCRCRQHLRAARVDGGLGWMVRAPYADAEEIAIAFIIPSWTPTNSSIISVMWADRQVLGAAGLHRFSEGYPRIQVGEAAARAWLIFAVAAVLITLFLNI
jgi:hypothetical protein